MEQEVKPVYLVMVTADNHNKYYRMIPKGNTFDVEYGRVGASCQHATYNISQWNKKYNEKVKKGYVDQSDLMDDLIDEVKDATSKEYKDIEVAAVKAIVDRLQDMAKKSIQKNYKVGSEQVTQAMVDKAQAKIDAIAKGSKRTTLKKFNEDLIELFGIIPRKMATVSDFLAEKKDQIGDIIQREQDLLDVMKGQVVQRIVLDEEPADSTEPTQTILEALGLIIEETSDADMEHIKKLFGGNGNRVKNAWRVTNLRTQKRFDEFVDNEKITDIKDFLHGSQNANWWSIIGSGLNIRPANAASNGRMLGNGIYLANESDKSITYTSKSSYRYSNEKSGFIGIMSTAYGKHYDINAFDSKYYSFDFKKLQEACPGANCLHAHRGMNTGWCNLRHDEIVIYKEEQCTIKYLVEFE